MADEEQENTENDQNPTLLPPLLPCQKTCLVVIKLKSNLAQMRCKIQVVSREARPTK